MASVSFTPREVFLTTDGHVHSVLYLYPKNGDYESVVEFMRRERVIELSQENGGLLASSINIPLSRKGPILVLAKDAASDERLPSNPCGRASPKAFGRTRLCRGEMY